MAIHIYKCNLQENFKRLWLSFSNDLKPIVSDTGKNQSGLFVLFVVADSKLMLRKHWIHEMWVLSKQVRTVRRNVSHLK